MDNLTVLSETLYYMCVNQHIENLSSDLQHRVASNYILCVAHTYIEIYFGKSLVSVCTMLQSAEIFGTRPAIL